MKKMTIVVLSGLFAFVVIPAAYFFVVVPVLNQRANAIMLTGSGEDIEAQVKQANAKANKRINYPVKWDEKTLIVSETTARAFTEHRLILRKDPANSNKREPLTELPIRPANAAGLLFTGFENEAKASAFPLNDSRENLDYGGNYFLGNLRLTESAIVVLPDERYRDITLPEQQLSLLKFSALDDVSEKVGNFSPGARLLKIN
ncbi:lipoprotein BA_5634 family protein [Saccharibacillus kuerlensis]|uniref:Uncharacterized protein n=1 Tax=Saccharibacillus kuerlensis TaxID=459527 RepID=A0ABQ2L6T8_9BACL|nr:lipoprotein BA_5634 family protein [Saccharibacillus kuerlensis]GGO03079.1 hypothetical protein GCM10010969_27010 [Saccharibacillus kuerlensis]